MITLSIVIPVFNEEKRLYKTFEALESLILFRGLKLESVIFVNDGSTDKTLNILKSYATKNKSIPITISTYKTNKGKGYAVKIGMLASHSAYTLLCDADMSTPFSELKKFEREITESIPIIIGTRKNGESTVIVHQPKIRELLGKGFTRLTQFLLRLEVSDFTCGFKLFSKDAIPQIFTNASVNRWGYDAEILYIAKKKSLMVKEKPVQWSNGKGSHVNVFIAIPQTIFEMGKIVTIHSMLPQLIRLNTLSTHSYVKVSQFLTAHH